MKETKGVKKPMSGRADQAFIAVAGVAKSCLEEHEETKNMKNGHCNCIS